MKKSGRIELLEKAIREFWNEGFAAKVAICALAYFLICPVLTGIALLMSMTRLHRWLFTPPVTPVKIVLAGLLVSIMLFPVFLPDILAARKRRKSEGENHGTIEKEY